MLEQQRLTLMIFSVPFGLVVGSFLNVCIFRLPRNCMSIVHPRSRCTKCLSFIAWYDNFPLVSWLLLGGKCRQCRASISPRYVLVELLTGAFLSFVFYQELYGQPRHDEFQTAMWILTKVYIVGSLIVCTFIDFEFTILPDEITLSGIVAGLAACAAFPFLQLDKPLVIREPHLASLVGSAFGALAGGGAIYLVAVGGKLLFRYPEVLGKGVVRAVNGSVLTIRVTSGEVGRHMRLQVLRKDQVVCRTKIKSIRTKDEMCEIETRPAIEASPEQRVEFYVIKDTMGFGDVKFMAFVGAFLGWKSTLLAFFLACFFGVFFGVPWRIVTKNRYIPLGPFLSMGVLTMLLFGSAVYEGLERYIERHAHVNARSTVGASPWPLASGSSKSVRGFDPGRWLSSNPVLPE